MKTSLLIDLAVSLASGLSFLGVFKVYKPCRVAVLSGESGEFTVQETASRVCRARGTSLAALGDSLRWQFSLPKLANPDELSILRAGLALDKIEVLIFDPLYLSLLSGQSGQQIRPENLFDMGPLFLNVSRACLDVGCTPLLIHHTKRDSSAKRGPLDLDDLAYAGVSEFARQWCLLSRREDYEPGTGTHKLWWNIGGSIGQSGLWSIDVDEGVIDEQFGGRRWELSVITANEARASQSNERAEARTQRQRDADRADDAAVLVALDQLDPGKRGFGFNKVQAEARLSPQRMIRAVNRLVAALLVEEPTVEVVIGSGAKRTVKGIRRKVTKPTISNHFSEMV